MNNALGYLLRVKMRNYFRDLVKKPARLVLLIILVAAFAVTIIGGSSVQNDPERKVLDISLLCAGLNALLILIFSTSFSSGIQNGGRFFKMSDVNFIFPAPLSRHRVLLYGLIQQMGVNLFIGLFLLFQYSTLRSAFDITVWGLLLLFFTYTAVAFIGQCFGLFLYTFISSSDSRKKLVKTVYTLLVAAVVVYVGINVWAGKADLTGAFSQYGSSIFVNVFPVAGWMGAFAGCLLHGEVAAALMWFALTLIVYFAFLYIVAKSGRDFYEDVIASAEATQSAIVAARENSVPEATPRKIKVGKTGFSKGWGASVFFYKHLRENRRSTTFIVSTASLIYSVMTIIFSLFMRGSDSAIIAVLCFSAYMLIFMLPLGRFNRELFRPYIYLMPENPVKKMLFATLETLPTALIESAIIFIPCSIILKTGAAVCVLCIIARMSYSLLFTGGNIIVERLWSGNLSKVVGVFVYLFVNLILALPGLVLALVLPAAGIVIVDTTITALLLLVVCNIPITLLVFYLCRNMLQYSESAA
jgi:hypothetical protein